MGRLRDRVLSTCFALATLGALVGLPVLAQVPGTTEWCDFYSDDSTSGGDPVAVGAVIDAYDPQGVHCGSFTVHTAGQWGLLHVYADDPLTPGVDEGAEAGDTIAFTINGEPTAVVAGDATWASKGLNKITLGPLEPSRFATPTWWSTLSAYLGTSWDAKPRVLADVNGDGMADVVLFHPTRGIKVSLSNGAKFAKTSWWTTLTAFSRTSWDAYPRFVVDVNGDGRDDAVVFDSSRGIKVALSNGTKFGLPTWWSQSALLRQTSHDAYPRFLADVNGDGRSDAVLFHPTSGVHVALSDGSRFLAPQLWSTESAFMQASQQVDPRFVADVNGDGMADIVLLHHADGVQVGLSTGSAFAPSTLWTAEAGFQRSSQDAFPRLLADVNGDGMDDLVLFHPTDGVQVSLSTGTGFAASTRWSKDPTYLKTSWDANPRLLADANGDGAADATLFHPTKGVKVGLASE